MNEIDLYRDARPDTAPYTPDAMASARRRLVQQATKDAAATSAPAGRPRRRRRLLVGVPVMAALAAAAVVVAAAGGTGTGPGEGKALRAQPVALTFKEEGGFIEVRIKDPRADAERYERELKARGLNINVILVPASPGAVGTIGTESYLGRRNDHGWFKPLSKESSGCPEGMRCGLRIPKNFHGKAEIEISRPARPGEKYRFAALADVPGEETYGMKYKSRRVGEVFPELARRHITVSAIGYVSPKDACTRPYRDGAPAENVNKNWYVYDILALSKGQVTVHLGPEHTNPSDKLKGDHKCF